MDNKYDYICDVLELALKSNETFYKIIYNEKELFKAIENDYSPDQIKKYEPTSIDYLYRVHKLIEALEKNLPVFAKQENEKLYVEHCSIS